MTIAVSIVRVDPKPIAVVRRKMPLSDVPKRILSLFDIVYTAAARGVFEQRGHNVAVYRPIGGGMFEVEVGVEVAGKFEDAAEVASTETPGGEAATAVHMGPYDKLPHQEVDDWAQKYGHRLTGICWEIYGDWDDDPAKRRTDIFHLLAKS